MGKRLLCLGPELPRTVPRTLSRLLAISVLALNLPALAEQPHVFSLSGDIERTHDPAIIKTGDTWYVFATGRGPAGGEIPIRCSKDLEYWAFCGQVLDQLPAWIHQESPGTRDLWAPDISFFNGKFHLYYAYSLFGKNTSGIALLTNTTIDPKSREYEWHDEGSVLRSRVGDDFNAIDPNLILDQSECVDRLRQLLEWD